MHSQVKSNFLIQKTGNKTLIIIVTAIYMMITVYFTKKCKMKFHKHRYEDKRKVKNMLHECQTHHQRLNMSESITSLPLKTTAL